MVRWRRERSWVFQPERVLSVPDLWLVVEKLGKVVMWPVDLDRSSSALRGLAFLESTGLIADPFVLAPVVLVSTSSGSSSSGSLDLILSGV